MNNELESNGCALLQALVKHLESAEAANIDEITVRYKKDFSRLISLCSDPGFLREILKSDVFFRAEFKAEGKKAYDRLITIAPDSLEYQAAYAAYLRFQSDYPEDEEDIESRRIIKVLNEKGYPLSL